MANESTQKSNIHVSIDTNLVLTPQPSSILAISLPPTWSNNFSSSYNFSEIIACSYIQKYLSWTSMKYKPQDIKQPNNHKLNWMPIQWCLFKIFLEPWYNWNFFLSFDSCCSIAKTVLEILVTFACYSLRSER